MAALIGCGAQAGGQTGEESDGVCTLVVTPLSLEETSPLGFSGADILQFSQGEKQAALRWLPPTDLPYGPEQGESELVARVTARGQPEFTEPAPQERNLVCTAAVRIPVTLELSTTGGALNELVETRVVARTPSQAELFALLEASKIQGDFAFDSARIGASKFTGLEVAVYFENSTFSGVIQGGVQSGGGTSDDSVASFRPVPLACWGTGQAPNQAICAM